MHQMEMGGKRYFMNGRLHCRIRGFLYQSSAVDDERLSCNSGFRD